MKTTMIACDNPQCQKVAQPEWVSDSGRAHRPPNGWLHLKGHFQGTGPTVTVEVCSTECVNMAIEAQVAEFYRDH